MTSNATCASPATVSSNSITMSVNAAVTPAVSIAITSGSQTSCPGTGITFTATPVNGGSGPAYNFLVNGTSVQSGSAAVYSSSSLTNGATVSCVMISNANCATTSSVSSNSIQVTIGAPTVTITPGGPTSFCTGASVSLTATEGSAYKWSNGLTTQSITATTSGNYKVTVTVAAGCSAASAATVVKVNTLPKATITAGGPVAFCAGGSVMLSATAGTYTYVWSSGQTTQAVEVTEAGSYVVTVISAAGCFKASAPAKVTVNALPAAVIVSTGSLCSGGKDTLTATKITRDTYHWSTGAVVNKIEVQTAGEYIVTIANTKCSAVDTAIVNNCGESFINAPSAIGPMLSADNNNFYAEVFPNPYAGEFHIKIQSLSSEDINITVFDVSGKLIEERTALTSTSDIILGNAYAAGCYVVQVQQGQATKQLRVVKVE
jgi:hypothetical protein